MSEIAVHPLYERQNGRLYALYLLPGINMLRLIRRRAATMFVADAASRYLRANSRAAQVMTTEPSAGEGHMNRPRSSRLA